MTSYFESMNARFNMAKNVKCCIQRKRFFDERFLFLLLLDKVHTVTIKEEIPPFRLKAKDRKAKKIKLNST